MGSKNWAGIIARRTCVWAWCVLGRVRCSIDTIRAMAQAPYQPAPAPLQQQQSNTNVVVVSQPAVSNHPWRILTESTLTILYYADGKLVTCIYGLHVKCKISFLSLRCLQMTCCTLKSLFATQVSNVNHHSKLFIGWTNHYSAGKKREALSLTPLYHNLLLLPMDNSVVYTVLYLWLLGNSDAGMLLSMV